MKNNIKKSVINIPADSVYYRKVGKFIFQAIKQDLSYNRVAAFVYSIKNPYHYIRINLHTKTIQNTGWCPWEIGKPKREIISIMKSLINKEKENILKECGIWAVRS